MGTEKTSLENESQPSCLAAVSGSFNGIKIDDVWTACSRIKADKGHLLNKSTEWNNAYQEGFEDCFEWLKNYR